MFLLVYSVWAALKRNLEKRTCLCFNKQCKSPMANNDIQWCHINTNFFHLLILKRVYFLCELLELYFGHPKNTKLHQTTRMYKECILYNKSSK